MQRVQRLSLLARQRRSVQRPLLAMQMPQLQTARALHIPAMGPSYTYGKGKWPSVVRGVRGLSGEAGEAEKVERMEFKAETRKLLDIVTNSIYTDKEVFIRELISNASDALEKCRYKMVTGEVAGATAEAPLEINIVTDEKRGILTIVDNGIGMSRDELVGNLGTIARSGSRQFVDALGKGEDGEAAGASKAAEGIIGQFGVGFYSSFMVSESVTVESVSALGGEEAHRWSSDGSGVFEVQQVSSEEAQQHLPAHRGSRIVMKLKESCSEYADPEKIKSVIKRYSSFVAFPVKVNGEVVNTVQAVWAMEKTAVTEQMYDDFYRFVANAYDKPKYRLHFRTDAPIDLKCLFYIPSLHNEKFGMGRTDPGVNLYSRKVLIEAKPADLLPSWLRFVKGVVDSEDLPLSLSREKPQDSSLLRRIKDVVTRKLLRFLSDEMKNKPESYREFYLEYHMFLKEGVCQDYAFMTHLSKLLLFETSISSPGELTSLDDYISRCSPEQKHLYYLVAPNREAALSSPYYETFKKHNIEVLLLFNTIDDFVMSNVREFGGRTLTSAETSSIDLRTDGGKLDEVEKVKEEEEEKDGGKKGELTAEQATEFCEWLQLCLGSRIKEARVTKRLSDSPAIVTDHESGALRRMMKMLEQSNAGASTNELPPQVLEVNPSHPLVVALHALKDSPTARPVAQLVAEQMLDNCLMAAGLVEDPRYMIPRLNDLLLATALHHKQGMEEDKDE
ncbi:Hsp90 protein-domain-containing protein [Ochromonadaceae sp. CCMP2298]|nr:Hsp90 protein-domain-containing protein [Ochromonadaceae sp. CCMP2298]|mmetsp:Transcript_3744/g.8207  ORF Transcript_3744/g.8207 Transcript_3744/m.8207 type:complete len:731 (+) Transcript_3744:88-2280(+)